MPTNLRITISAAWYHGGREEFLRATSAEIAGELALRAADENLDVEAAQAEEWRQSVSLLQVSLGERIPILHNALNSPGCEAIEHVILEFDFRRRGLRIDCLLLGKGVLFVVEFKRSRFARSDRDQVMSYAVNLLEFHKVTSDWCDSRNAIVVPVLALTAGKSKATLAWPGLYEESWPALAERSLECDASTLSDAIRLGLENRKSDASVDAAQWLASPFRPSSSILDATLSLYGNHDVAAIQEHAAPKSAIDASVHEIKERIAQVLERGEYHIIFLSGAPGAGKTLVGLDVVMRGSQAGGAVFVTGNAPLVEVLNKALTKSYQRQAGNATSWIATGYRRKDAKHVSAAANFKIVKAHHYLGHRGEAHRQEDGRVLVFDEAQRTYEKGRPVLGKALEDHEADLILDAQRKAFPTGGAVVVALIGHNQAINRGERGIVAWLDAAVAAGWNFSIADETLALAEFQDRAKWAVHARRCHLKHGHLHQSMRYYRNSVVENWVGAVLSGETALAKSYIATMEANENTILITRELSVARRWAKALAIGGQRAGLIASGQARRLASEGLFVDYKPDIGTWMLAPSSDIRSSNALETVQNQYQVQGLELDYTIVCWDADLRRESGRWEAYKLSGSDWQSDSLTEVAKNGYRVLLTRARKGMVIFVPMGDPTGDDETRNVDFYDGVFSYLLNCGARRLVV